MHFLQLIFIFLFTCSFLFTSACSTFSETDNVDPENIFVYNSDEFNRETFTEPAIKNNTVTICYNSFDTTSVAVSSLAVKECAKYNKSAVYVEQLLLVCPLFTPIGAVYNCCSRFNKILKNSDVIQNSNKISCKERKL